jgi:hypothetical protein
MSTTSSVYNLGRVTQSPHLTKTLIHRFVTPRLSITTVFTTSYGAPQMCPQPQTCCPFVTRLHQVNTDFGSTSHMPPIDLCFQTSPKSPRASHPWLLVFHLGSSASVLPCLRTLPQTCSLQILLPKLPSLVVRPCALIGTPRVTNVKCHVLWVCHTPSRTITLKQLVAPLCGPGVPKQAHAPINHHVSWTVHPSLGVCPLPCALPCVDHHDSSWVCRMGSSNLFGAPMLPRADESTPWACSQVAPPCPNTEGN